MRFNVNDIETIESAIRFNVAWANQIHLVSGYKKLRIIIVLLIWGGVLFNPCLAITQFIVQIGGGFSFLWSNSYCIAMAPICE